MSDRAYIAVVVLVLFGLTFGLIAGHGPWAGRELMAFSQNHGLNRGDLAILAAWLVGVLCCWRLWTRR